MAKRFQIGEYVKVATPDPDVNGFYIGLVLKAVCPNEPDTAMYLVRYGKTEFGDTDVREYWYGTPALDKIPKSKQALIALRHNLEVAK